MSCGDFAGSVQDRSHDHRERAGYDVERLFGTVGAKTITSETSSEATIIFPWEAFNSLPEAVLYPLSAHEALHAALHQRDETLTTLRPSLGLDASSAAGLWAELAGVAIDEYRIERALDDQELIIEPTHCSSIPLTLVVMQQRNYWRRGRGGTRESAGTRRPARHRRRHHHRAPRHRCPARTCRPVLERPLHTERLTLRPATADEADANWKYRRPASVNAS